MVKQIPRGQVMTYGQIADILGEGYTARTIGFVMHGADTENVPWQRVINSKGSCSTRQLTMPINLQQQMLESEGIKFDAGGRCDLRLYQWSPAGSDQTDDTQTSLFE